MKLKKLLSAALLIAGLLNAKNGSAQSWNLNGNAATTATNYLGTSDSKDLRIKTNNVVRMTINANGFTDFKTGYLTLSGISSIYQSGNDLRILAYAPGINGSLIPGNIILAKATGNFKSGNVGIGANDVSRAKLVVEGNVGKTTAIFGQGSAGISFVQNWPGIGFNSYFSSTIWKSLSSGYGAQIALDPTSGALYFGSSNHATAADQTLSGTTSLIIHGNGSVGVNNLSAISTLDVTKKTGNQACASFWGATSNFASHFCFGTNEDTYIRGGNPASNVIIADITNNVGIGTTAPAYKLDVCGTMRAKEVRVATGWCDYVFADDYKLPALSEIESFIKTNKHLPDVTPGSVIEGEGLEVGKTSAQMIKKIEELTLYVIDLQKQVNDLKHGNK